MKTSKHYVENGIYQDKGGIKWKIIYKPLIRLYNATQVQTDNENIMLNSQFQFAKWYPQLTFIHK